MTNRTYNNSRCNNCGCNTGCDRDMRSRTLAMAWMTDHQFNNAYELGRALRRGTLFPELDKPFRGTVTGGNCNG